MSLLFYDDSPVFGGHEVMTLLGLEHILVESSEEVHFLASPANGKLVTRLKALAEEWPLLKFELLPWHSSKIEGLRNLIQPGRVKELASMLNRLQPKLVIAVQGNIEHSSLALLAARKAGISCTSYLPVPHTNAEMGAKLGGIRDLFCRHLFKAPDSFITITDEMAGMLKRRGVTCPIHVVYNGVDIHKFVPKDKVAAKDLLGLPQDLVVFGMVGRLECKQKQQHRLVDAVASQKALLENCHLVFAGEGPDKVSLEGLIKELGVSATVLPWTDPSDLYSALDALVIPSRYEGLPLVMLEALACGTAVLASDRDGMRDVLPNIWRFDPDDTSAIAAVLMEFIREGKPGPDANLMSRIRTEMSLEAFKNSFANTVFSLA